MSSRPYPLLLMSSSVVLNAKANFKDWIGVNKSIKIYLDLRNALLQIPDLRSKHLFPSSNLSVNNSGFYLPPIDMVLLDTLEKGKAQLRKEMKAFRKGKKVEDRK